MTTFAHHSLAETWNFVASITGTQVFICAMNFKLYVQSTVKKKRKERKASPPLPAQLQEGVLVQNVPFCRPLQPPVPPCRERALGLTFCAFSLLQCCSHRRNSARKAISCKNSGQWRKKEQTYTLYSVLLPRSIVSFQTLTHQVEEIGDNTEKSSFPPGEPTEPISVCATPKCSNYSSFSHCVRLHITSSLLLELEENCSGEAFPPFA